MIERSGDECVLREKRGTQMKLAQRQAVNERCSSVGTTSQTLDQHWNNAHLARWTYAMTRFFPRARERELLLILDTSGSFH